MTDLTPRAQEQTEVGWSRNDTALWSRYIETLKAPEGVVSPNVQGRRPMSPLQGFGKLW